MRLRFHEVAEQRHWILNPFTAAQRLCLLRSSTAIFLTDERGRHYTLRRHSSRTNCLYRRYTWQ